MNILKKVFENPAFRGLVFIISGILIIYLPEKPMFDPIIIIYFVFTMVMYIFYEILKYGLSRKVRIYEPVILGLFTNVWLGMAHPNSPLISLFYFYIALIAGFNELIFNLAGIYGEAQMVGIFFLPVEGFIFAGLLIWVINKTIRLGKKMISKERSSL